MTQGLYHYVRNVWKKPDQSRVRELMTQWRREQTVTVLERPTRIDRARALGYKAKKGFLVARVRIARGGRKRARPRKGRRSKRMSIIKTLKMNYQWVAEIRAQKKFVNLEVLHSYYLAKDGRYYFYEVILVDPERPEIKNDPTINWITRPENRGRVYRGLTGAAKRSRGLRSKNPMNKNRPSVRAGKRKGK
ncbi:MAG: 50S ribosomal protein L15e [Nanoarchaeota archaeon]